MKRIIIINLIIFFNIYVCLGKETDTAESCFNQGEECYALYNFEEAIKYYNKSVEINPKYVPAYESKGWSMCKLRNAKEMIKCFDKVQELDKNGTKNYKINNINVRTAKDYLSRGAMYNSENRFLESFNDYNNAIQLDKDYLKAYYYRALLYTQIKEYNKATDDFNKVLEFSPKNGEVLYGRAFCYSNIGKYNESIADYTEYIRLNPKNFYGYINRGYQYKLLQDYEKAVIDYIKAIKLDSKSAMAYNSRGMLYFKNNEYKNARKDFEKAIKLDPNGKYGKPAKENLEYLNKINKY